MDSFLSNWLELMMHEGKPISRKIYKTCTKCHLSWEEFRKTGKVGCAECYRSFQPEILSVIQQIQGTSIHVGKAPEKSTEEIAKNKKMKNRFGQDMRSILHHQSQMQLCRPFIVFSRYNV